MLSFPKLMANIKTESFDSFNLELNPLLFSLQKENLKLKGKDAEN